MILFKLIIENSWHDLKSSDGRISIATQAALIFFLLTLSLTSESIQRYLTLNLDQMLGSDLVLENHTALSQEDETTLSLMADQISKTAVIKITVTHNNTWARVQLKQVDDAYPLQGALKIGNTPAAQQRDMDRGPGIGEIWLGSRLATRLSAYVGDNIILGDTRLYVSGILFHEPDRIMEGHNVELRAMIHNQSLTNTSFTRNSQRRFRYLITADETARREIETWAKSTLAGANMIKKYGGHHPLAGFWKRTENFLGLASVILFFMGAVALDMTNRRWLAKMRYRLAVYMSLGTRISKGMGIALSSWLISFLFAILLGSTLALIAHTAIILELQAYFPDLTSAYALAGIGKTIGLIFLLLLALQIPSFIQLHRTSILLLIRNGIQTSYIWHRLFWGLASSTLLAVAYSDNWLLTAMTLGSILIALVLMASLTWCMIKLGGAWAARRSGLFPFAFFIMRQRLFAKSAQVMGLGLCGLLLLFSLMLMRDFGTMIEGHTRIKDGNLLISEAQVDHITPIHNWATTTNSNVRSLRPFVSAQLVAVNDQALSDYMKKPSDTLAALQNPIRLSWSDNIPANNQQMGGTWWTEGTVDWQQISTEPEVMTDMSLTYGDKLTYIINGNQYTFTLVASHAYKPGGSSITFWFQVPESALAKIDAPIRYMGSMELPKTAWPELSSLWQQAPSLSLVPLQELTERFDQMLAIVAKVTSGYAAMVLLLALFVLTASVSGFRADDQLKNGLLMSMGLRQKDCLKLNLYDWALTALIAAIGAISGTWIAGILIYEEQFNLSYNPDIAWVTGITSVMVCVVCLVGSLACRQSLKVSVRDLMQA